MSNFCTQTPAVLSTSAMNQAYQGTNFLPSSGVERDANGRLTDGTLSGIYDNMTRNNQLMSVQTYKQKLTVVNNMNNNRDAIRSALEGLGTLDKSTMDDIAKQFCFNYVRYKFALQDLFDTLIRTSTANQLLDSDKRLIDTKLNSARLFNNNLNDLIQITNFIAVKRAEEMGTQNAEINGLNDRIKQVYDKIQQDGALLKREDATTELRKRMVEYTQEKNLSANNLLSLYGFLNLVALGLLFYISRT